MPDKIYSELEEDITDVINLLDCNYDESLILLHFFQWNKENLQNTFFENENKYKILAGIILKNQIEINKDNNCLICYEDISKTETSCLICNHTFCRNCWKDYLILKV